MHSKFLNAAAALVMAAGAATQAAYAAPTVQVPFSFTVGGVTWAGGAYTVERNALHNLVTVRSADGRHVASWALMPGNPSPDDEAIKLAFDRDSTGQVLHRVQYGALSTASLDKKHAARGLQSGL